MRPTKLTRALKWLDEHPLTKLGAYVVAACVGISAIVGAYVLVRNTFFKAEPLPNVLQLEQVTENELTFDPGKRSVEVLLQNPSDQMLVVTGVNFRTTRIPPNYIEFASGPVLPDQIYRLPVNCETESGHAELRPAYSVDPKSAAAFIIEGDREEMACLIFLSFETNHGRTEEKLAKGF